MLAEAAGGTVMAVLTQDPWATGLVVVGLLLGLLIIATFLAPMSQRDEAWEAHRRTLESMAAMRSEKSAVEAERDRLASQLDASMQKAEALKDERDDLKRKLTEAQRPAHDAKPSGRRLSETQTAALTDAIANAGAAPENLHVLYDNADVECADFAADLGAAVERAGIECSVHDGLFYDKNVRDRGVKIVRGQTPEIAELGDAIHDKLAEFGFSPERRRAEQDDRIFLFVARAPQD